MEDDDIRTMVKRLARPHASGGKVIERAAIMAEGADFTEVMAWIESHDGKPEERVSAGAKGGLHGTRINDGGGAKSALPLRFVLPDGALG